MIRVQNIYYMLAYAFHILREQGYESCGTEEFENTIHIRIHRELIIGTDKLLFHDRLLFNRFRNVYFAAQTAQRLRLFDIGTAQTTFYLHGYSLGKNGGK